MSLFDDRQARIAQLVKGHLHGALDGTEADEQQLIAAHVDLMPELEHQLRKARLVQAAYAQNTQDAISAGVFGAPWYVFDGQPFWGQDRLDFLERALTAA